MAPALVQPRFSFGCAITAPVKILVAEDQDRLSAQLSGALSKAGYAVDCAADGERADFLAATGYPESTA